VCGHVVTRVAQEKRNADNMDNKPDEKRRRVSDDLSHLLPGSRSLRLQRNRLNAKEKVNDPAPAVPEAPARDELGDWRKPATEPVSSIGFNAAVASELDALHALGKAEQKHNSNVHQHFARQLKIIIASVDSKIKDMYELMVAERDVAVEKVTTALSWERDDAVAKVKAELDEVQTELDEVKEKRDDAVRAYNMMADHVEKTWTTPPPHTPGWSW
jgi:hypothetical protein